MHMTAQTLFIQSVHFWFLIVDRHQEECIAIFIPELIDLFDLLPDKKAGIGIVLP